MTPANPGPAIRAGKRSKNTRRDTFELYILKRRCEFAAVGNGLRRSDWRDHISVDASRTDRSGRQIVRRDS